MTPKYFFTMLALALPLAAPGQFVAGSLKAQLKMDQSSGSTISDDSGNGNTAALRERQVVNPAIVNASNGATMITDGPTPSLSTQRNAVSMDWSNNDLLFVEDETGLDFDKTRGAISFWLRVTSDERMSIMRCRKNGVDTGFSLERSGSGVSHAVFFEVTGTDYISNHDPALNTWEHYVFTWDLTLPESTDLDGFPDRIQVFVNGVEVGPHPSSSIQTDSDIILGNKTADDAGRWYWGNRSAESGGFRPYDGDMADIGIYDDLLTPAEINAIYQNGVDTLHPDIVAAYDFSEGTGTSVADDVGSADMVTSQLSDVITAQYVAGNGTSEGPIWATANAGANKPSYITNALQFDGTDDAVTIPDSATLDAISDAGTVVAWLYFPSAGAGRRGLIGSSGTGFQAEAHSSANLYFYPQTTISSTLAIGGTRTFDDWMHVAFRWDRDGLDGPNMSEIYFDGVLVASDTTTWSTIDLTAVTNDWTIGRKAELSDTSNPRWFLGQMADIGIFDVVLSPADIQAIIDNGIDGFEAGLPVELDSFLVE